MITGTIGRLGTGKTLSGVIEAYSAYLKGEEVFSNIWLDFPHNPVKTVEDFLSVEDGFFLVDELWHIADCRRSMSALNDLVSIILLRSRKRNMDVYFTQQFMQVDIRINYVTDYWVYPAVYPTLQEQRAYHVPPKLLVQKWYDSEMNYLDTRVFSNISQFLILYATNKDPYTLGIDLKTEKVKKLIGQLKAVQATSQTYG